MRFQLYIALEMLPLQTTVAIFFTHPVMAAMLEFFVRGDNLNIGSVAGEVMNCMKHWWCSVACIASGIGGWSTLACQCRGVVGHWHYA